MATSQHAIDFQYGEIESKRLGQSVALRHISLVAWYRYLSAYGARPGLALFWLLLGIFVLFPILYWLTGYSHHAVDVIVHSLETSTFLEASKSSENLEEPVHPNQIRGRPRTACGYVPNGTFRAGDLAEVWKEIVGPRNLGPASINQVAIEVRNKQEFFVTVRAAMSEIVIVRQTDTRKHASNRTRSDYGLRPSVASRVAVER